MEVWKMGLVQKRNHKAKAPKTIKRNRCTRVFFPFYKRRGENKVLFVHIYRNVGLKISFEIHENSWKSALQPVEDFKSLVLGEFLLWGVPEVDLVYLVGTRWCSEMEVWNILLLSSMCNIINKTVNPRAGCYTFHRFQGTKIHGSSRIEFTNGR